MLIDTAEREQRDVNLVRAAGPSLADDPAPGMPGPADRPRHPGRPSGASSGAEPAQIWMLCTPRSVDTPDRTAAQSIDPVAPGARSRIAVSDWGSVGLSVYQTGLRPLRAGGRRGSLGLGIEADDGEAGRSGWDSSRSGVASGWDR